jgi:hypothetical protein
MDRRAFLLGFGVAIIVGSYFGWMTHNKRKFPGFPGQYVCDDFGAPTPEERFLFIGSEGAVESAKELSGPRVPLGKVTVENSKRAVLELDANAIQTPEFTLNAAIENAIVPDHRNIRLVGTDNGQQQYSHHCVRK